MADRSGKNRPARRIVRRMDVGRPSGFDEKLWPVNVALLLLAAFVEGVIIARLDFFDPRPLYNAWTWTGTLLLSIGMGVWLVQRLDNRHVRRSVQLATVLSLLFHAVLVVLINKDFLFALVDPEPPEETVEIQTYAVPVAAPDAPQFDFERPIETRTPDAVEQAPTRVEPPVEPQPTTDPTPPAPMPEQAVEANVPQLNRPDQTTPRRSDTQSQLSRNATPSPNDPQTEANAPRISDSAQPQPRELDAAASPSRRETAGPQTPRSAAQAPTTADAQRPDLPSRTPRRTEDVAQSSASPTLPRRVADPAQTPTTAIEPADVASTPRRTTPNEIDPRITADRRAASVPRVERSAEAPTPQPNEVTRAPDAPRQPRRDAVAAPRVTNPSTPASRARPSIDPSATASATAPRTPSAAPSPAPSLEPTAPSAERSTAARAAIPSQTTGAPNSSAAPAPSPSAAVGNRAERAVDPGAAGAIAQAPRNRRTASAPQLSDTAGSPSAANQPRSTASTEQGPRPSPEPGNVAERRSTSGVAGQGRSPNLDVGPGALQRPGRVASDSAVRARATQDAPNGSALSPAAPTLVGKRRADASLPSSTLQAQDVPHATSGGVAEPSLLDADAALTTARANASAPRGRTTADRGAATVDLGPRQVVGEGGSGRPSGGGQPNVGDIAHSNTPTRRTPGGDRPSLVDAATPAAIAQAPQPSGTAGTAAGEAQPQPGDLASQRSQSSPGGAISGAAGGDAPSGAVDDEVTAAADGGGRPSGAGDEVLVSTPGIVVDGRRAVAGGIPEAGPATAPQLAGGPSEGSGEPGDPNSAGSPNGEPLDQQGPSDRRSTAGLAGRSTVGPAGAATGPAIADVADVGRPGDRSGRRDPLGGLESGSAMASVGGGPRRRATIADVPSGIGAAEAPVVGRTGPTSDVSGELPEGTLAGEPSRRDGGPPAFVRVETGPGGLGAEPALEAGTADRRSRPDVPDLAINGARIAARRSSSLPTVDGQVRMAIDSYKLRRARRYRDAEVPGAGRPSPKTEETVEAGLEFLARAQSPDGSWSLHDYRGKPATENCRIHSNTAATGLALLAYLGAAYDHYDDKYQEVVRGGLEWLIAHQDESGDLYVAQDAYSNQSARLYSHAIAAIALCEAYGMTSDERLKEPAQRAIDFIVAAQHRDFGGWRYSAVPGSAGYDSDTSVSGWMLMALRSAELAKLNVPKETFTRVEGWLEQAAAPGTRGARYVYDPKAQGADKAHGRRESPQMTSIGLLMRMYLGWDRTKPEMVRGADYLAETLPTAVENPATAWHGAYYWYYATQVMFHMRGEHWAKWNERLHPLLTGSQREEGPLSGSWDPDGPASDMWGQFGGRIYVTTLNLLSLEVYYRHLPIYEDTAR